MTLTYFIIFSLAVWRISSLFVSEAGPWKMFQSIREAAGILHDGLGTPYMFPDGFFPELLKCIWCTSLWVGGFFVILYLLFPWIAIWIALPFALSAGCILFDKLVKG